MAFTSWGAIRDDIKNVLAEYALSGKFMTKEYEIDGFRRSIQSIDEAKKFYELTFQFEAMDTPGSASTRVSYGKMRRFR